MILRLMKRWWIGSVCFVGTYKGNATQKGKCHEWGGGRHREQRTKSASALKMDHFSILGGMFFGSASGKQYRYFIEKKELSFPVSR